MTSDTVAATGITLHNPQYGPGGARQYFLDIKQGIADGSISVLDHAGRPVPVPPGTDGGGVEKVIRDSLGLGGTIRLVGAESPDFTRVVSTGNVETMPTWRTVLAGIGYETSLHTPSRGPAR